MTQRRRAGVGRRKNATTRPPPDPRLDGGVIVHFDAGFCTRFRPTWVTTFFEIQGTGGLVTMGLDAAPVTHGPAWLSRVPGGLDADRFLLNERGEIAITLDHGPQLVDLWAAHRAVSYLVANGYRGPALFVGDGLGVIEFLRRKGPLNLPVDDPKFAGKLRVAIARAAAPLRDCYWGWIPTEFNRAANRLQRHAKDYCKKYGAHALGST